jgi:tetratricopeptide (TPR) repeat protein/tRNA A-37 threonylcarbamoyl transferase component Bud32
MAEFQDRLQAVVGDTYRIIDELGGGGMSRVLLAEEVGLHRKVVIKVLPPEMTGSVNIERFQREIQLAASLQHPHIVQLLTAGAEGDLLYYVMPYIEGESLRGKLAREGSLPVGDVLRILRDVTDALAHAHDKGVVHRDIKPDNVMLSGKHALVTDFGVAKAVAASSGKSSTLTSLGVALGTPAYMSPEQAAADPHTDHRADIYALGAMAYEMLCGQPPFTAPTPQAVLAAHVTEKPDPVEKYRSAVQPALSGMVMRCLEKLPADRWQGADEVLAQLEVMTTPSGGMTPTSTTPVNAVSVSQAVRRGHPVRVAALFGVVAAVILGLTYTVMFFLGLPDWVFLAAVVLLAVGLPVMITTGLLEKRRAVDPTTQHELTGVTKQVHGFFTWQRALKGGTAAFVGLALVAGGWSLLKAMGVGPAATLVSSGALNERDRVILAEFDNVTSDSTIGETVTELLRIDLSRSPTITLVDNNTIGVVLRRMERAPDTRITSDVALEIAEREGIKAVVTGEVRAVGGGYVLAARIESPSGEVLVAERESAARSDDLVAAVDELSARLRERTGESLRTIRAEAPLENVTTASMEALRIYTRAEAVNDQGDTDLAASLLEDAIELDSSFAMAYRKLGIVIANAGGEPDRRDSAFARAYALRDNLPDRERYWAEAAYHAYVTHDTEAVITAYRTLLDKYATDAVALNNLALRYERQGRYHDAVELLQRSLDAGNTPAVTLFNMLDDQARIGDLESTERTLAQFADLYPDNPSVGWSTVNVLWVKGERDSARAMLQTTMQEHRNTGRIYERSAGALREMALFHGALEESWRWHAVQMDSRPEFVARGEPTALQRAIDEVDVNVWFQGDPNIGGSLDRLDGLVDSDLFQGIPAEERPYMWLVIINAWAGRPDRARAIHDEYQAEVDSATRAERDFAALWMDTEMAIAEGRPLAGVAGYHALREENPGCLICWLFNIGAAFEKAGNADSAIAYYQRHLEVPWLFRIDDDAWASPAAYRRLGALYEERGKTELALENYGKFVDVWREADPVLQPQVEDIRERMVELAGEGD